MSVSARIGVLVADNAQFVDVLISIGEGPQRADTVEKVAFDGGVRRNFCLRSSGRDSQLRRQSL
jgi:hypothetical protein